MERMIKRLFSFNKSVGKKEYWETMLVLLLMNIIILALYLSFGDYHDIPVIREVGLFTFAFGFLAAYIVFPITLMKGRAKHLGRNEILPPVLLFGIFFFLFDFTSLFFLLFISLLFTYGLMDTKA